MDTTANNFLGMYKLKPEDILRETERIMASFSPEVPEQILQRLIEQVQVINFREIANLTDDRHKLTQKHVVVIAVDQILELAKRKKWGIVRKNGSVYVYNGSYWVIAEEEEFKNFLGEAAEKMGVDTFDARHHGFRENLYQQFLAVGHLQKPSPPEDVVLINLKNGTFEVSARKQELRPHDPKDFHTYRLPFDYDPSARAPLFQAYLDKVQPDRDVQKLLAEYIGYLFIRPSILKLEKALLLFGTGANGKSVFFEVIYALLGSENITSYSLQKLTEESGGAYRAKIENKLLNYATEISGKLEASVFKAMVSGEPIEAKPLYAQPYSISNYAKMIFNCNELPKDVEQTNAYFRRLLVVPFSVTIPEAEQDRELPRKIMRTELSGVFNWALDGLRRLLLQRRFTECEAVTRQVEQYRRQSDSVMMFLDEENYSKATEPMTSLQDLYSHYKHYCTEGGFKSCSRRSFADRLRSNGYDTVKKRQGQMVYVKKESFL